MIVVKLQGGLGNQMFQYAIGKILAEKFGVALYSDNSYFEDQEKKPGFTPRNHELDIFKPVYQPANKKLVQSFYKKAKGEWFRKLIGLPLKKIIREDFCHFDASILTIEPPLYLDGYFQSEKYFKGNENLVKEIFTFPNVSEDKYTGLINKILVDNSVAVHFRRGDYISDNITSSIHGVCSLDYYINAINKIKNQLIQPHFYIFSDDIEWVIKHVDTLNINYTLVKGNTGNDSWIDMMLMSKCKHHIIANSSFSWWGAWLQKDTSKIVIAPLKWFNDQSVDTQNIVPDSWIRI